MRNVKNWITVITTIFFLTPLFFGVLTCAGEEIPVDSQHSPIHNYFTYKKILWTFDDYMIQYDHHPPHKGFYGLSKKIVSYGGYVNIMVIFTDYYYAELINNEIRNISVVNDFGISQDHINKSLDFFHQPHISAQCHGWSNAVDLNHATLSEAYHIINYTLWNWNNNYHIKPHFFLGHSKNGNYNITLALKKFSETYWPVYGENLRWYDKGLFPEVSRDAPAIDYVLQAEHTTELDPLFGCDWGQPCKTLEDAKTYYNTYVPDKEVIIIRGHPDFLNNTDEKSQQALKLWEEWIDWIFQNHNIINMNHTNAIYYNKDRHLFRVEKQNSDTFLIDLRNCYYDHRLLFTQPYPDISYNWTVFDEQQHCVGMVYNDTYIDAKAGHVYTFTTNEIPQNTINSLTVDDPVNDLPGIQIIGILCGVFIFVFVCHTKKHD